MVSIMSCTLCNIAQWVFGQIEVSEICENEAVLLESDVLYHPISGFLKMSFKIISFLKKPFF